MTTRNIRQSEAKLATAEKLMRAAVHSWTHGPGEVSKAAPRIFVTVSRQPGAGGISFSHQLADRLNRDEPEAQRDWAAWDQELVDRVALERGVSSHLIETLPTRQRSWLDELAESFASSSGTSEVEEDRAYKAVIVAVRSLAEKGHSVIVGLGGVFITDRFAQAVHLRLIAPLKHRIEHVAAREKLSLSQAARRVDQIDAARTQFYNRFWPGKAVSSEEFTMTLNSGEMSVQEMVEAVVPVVRLRETLLADAMTQPSPMPSGSGGSERMAGHAYSNCL